MSYYNDYNNNYNYNIINKDYYINKDDWKIKKYDDTSIKNYGNVYDILLSSLTTNELSKLRILVNFLGINSLNGTSDVVSLILLVTDSRYANDLYSILAVIGNGDANLRADTKNILMNFLRGNSRNAGFMTSYLGPQSRNNNSQNSQINNVPPIIQINQDNNKQPDSNTSQEESQKQRNPIIEEFMNDILDKASNPNFRGWMLPNGQLMSQYDDAKANTGTGRQDHAKLVKIFLNGLEKYDKDAYDEMMRLYDEYLSKQGLNKTDVDESFAVEVLGWIQIANLGLKLVTYRGERWQDKLVHTFLIDYGFRYSIADFGRSYEREFATYYDNIDQIIALGLEEKYVRTA